VAPWGPRRLFQLSQTVHSVVSVDFWSFCILEITWHHVLKSLSVEEYCSSNIPVFIISFSHSAITIPGRYLSGTQWSLHVSSSFWSWDMSTYIIYINHLSACRTVCSGTTLLIIHLHFWSWGLLFQLWISQHDNSGGSLDSTLSAVNLPFSSDHGKSAPVIQARHSRLGRHLTDLFHFDECWRWSTSQQRPRHVK